MTTTFESPERLLHAAPMALGASDWLVIDRARVDAFARATGDDGLPFGVPGGQVEPQPDTVQSSLVLSLVNHLLPQIVEVRGTAMGVNVGCNGVRFPVSVAIGARLRGRGRLTRATREKGGIQAVIQVTVEVAGRDEPACIVDTVGRYFPHN